MSLMAQVEQARNRLQESNQQLLAASGAIKGLMAASLKLEREARKVTYELKEDHTRITAANRRAFMQEQRRLATDPSHPLHGLLDDGRYHAKPVALQAGHTVTRNGLVRSLSGELETFALEEAIPNNYDSRVERQGEVLRKIVVDIGGSPVELTTARILGGVPGLVNPDIVANAPERPGWTAPNSLFTESIPDAAGSSQLRGILRGGSRALGPLGVALDAYSLKEAWDADGGRIGENVTSTAGGIAGGLGGAAAGAAIGSAILPVGGTIIGGVIGGVVGSGAGSAIAEGIGNLFD